MNLFIQIFQIAIDIMMYSVVHTGANTQLGGLKLAKIISEYQGSLNSIVATPPTKDAENVIKTNSIKDKNLFLIISILYISSWNIKKLFGLRAQVLVLENR